MHLKLSIDMQNKRAPRGAPFLVNGYFTLLNFLLDEHLRTAQFFGQVQRQHVAIHQLNIGYQAPKVFAGFLAYFAKNQSQAVLRYFIGTTDALPLGINTLELAATVHAQGSETIDLRDFPNIHPVADEANIQPITAGLVKLLVSLADRNRVAREVGKAQFCEQQKQQNEYRRFHFQLFDDFRFLGRQRHTLDGRCRFMCQVISFE